MDEPRSGQLEILDETECVKLLRSHDLGRIAVVDQNVRPLIFPVNYFFDEMVVAFRTAPGAKLRLAPGAHVSFEIDGGNANKGIGWSVLVKGTAHDITHPRGAPSGRIRLWPGRPPAPGSREHRSWIPRHENTGRRV